MAMVYKKLEVAAREVCTALELGMPEGTFESARIGTDERTGEIAVEGFGKKRYIRIDYKANGEVLVSDGFIRLRRLIVNKVDSGNQRTQEQYEWNPESRERGKLEIKDEGPVRPNNFIRLRAEAVREATKPHLTGPRR
jgi:hypothetical protein